MADSTRTRGYASAYSLIGSLTLVSFTDTVHERFRERKAAGELINSPMESVRYYADGPTYAYQSTGYVDPWGPRWPLGVEHQRAFVRSNTFNASSIRTEATYWAQVTNNLAFSQNERNIANTNVDAEIGSGISQLYVTLAESRKTVKMFADAVSLLRRPINDAMRDLRVTRQMMLTPEGRNRVLDRAGEFWLQGRYGWRPFVFDVMNTFEATLQNGRPQRFTARNRIVRTTSLDEPMYSVKHTNYLDWLGFSRKIEVVRTLRVGSTVDYLVDLRGNDAFAFGAFDFLGSAWELVRFSFIVDWFINVGDALQALQAYAMAKQRIAWETDVLSVRAIHKPIIPEIVIAPWPYTNPQEYIWYTDVPPKDQCAWTEQIKLTYRVPRTSFVPAIGYRCNIDWAKALDVIFILKKVLGVRVNR